MAVRQPWNPRTSTLFARALIDLLGPVVVEQGTHGAKQRTDRTTRPHGCSRSRGRCWWAARTCWPRSTLDWRIRRRRCRVDGPVGSGARRRCCWPRSTGHGRPIARSPRYSSGQGPGSTSTADVIGLLADQLGLTVPQAQTGVDQGDSLTSPGEAPDQRRGTVGLVGRRAGGAAGRDGDRGRRPGPSGPGDARDTVEVMRSLPPGGSRFLASTTGTRQTEALTVRGLQTVEVGPLAAADAAVAAREWARAEGARQLPGPVLQIMADRPRSGLWVRLAVAELSWLDATDYARAEAAAASGTDADRALTDLLVAEASELPAGIPNWPRGCWIGPPT